MSAAEPSVRALAARLTAIEARLADLEGPVLAGQYRMARRLVRVELGLEHLLQNAGLPLPSEENVDSRLDEE